MEGLLKDSTKNFEEKMQLQVFHVNLVQCSTNQPMKEVVGNLAASFA